MRKEEIITINDRGNELTFRIREMPATQLEGWLFRVGTALASTGFAKTEDIADGIDTIGVYRSSSGTFFLRNSNTAGPADMIFSLGIPGDVGIAGDWTGKGFDTTGVFRPSNGALYLKNTNATGFADVQINYGLPGDRPVTGDWDNNGTDTIGIYRNGTFMLRNSNTIGFAQIVFDLGVSGDMPIAGNWDGLP